MHSCQDVIPAAQVSDQILQWRLTFSSRSHLNSHACLRGNLVPHHVRSPSTLSISLYKHTSIPRERGEERLDHTTSIHGIERQVTESYAVRCRAPQAAWAADDGGAAHDRQGRAIGSVPEAREADEPARLHLRLVQPRHVPPDRDPPLSYTCQPGLLTVRRLRFRSRSRPSHRFNF